LAKLLFIVIAVFIAYWILKGYKKKVDRRSDSAAAVGEDMVRCAQCGVHLPRSESLTTASAFYCSAEHRRIHDKTG
jgi:uncharacterized protein